MSGSLLDLTSCTVGRDSTRLGDGSVNKKEREGRKEGRKEGRGNMECSSAVQCSADR
jgi:hypothetical protein